MQATLLAPVIVLAAWTHVMFLWMYVTRIPALRRLGMPLDPQAVRGEQMAKLPARVRWKADNYNHLMEQPTVFYAVAISLAILGANMWALWTAWIYVGLRVVHSLVQALWNRIEVRFTLFALSSIALIMLTVQALRLILRV
jgi:hypothetical protein